MTRKRKKSGLLRDYRATLPARTGSVAWIIDNPASQTHCRTPVTDKRPAAWLAARRRACKSRREAWL